MTWAAAASSTRFTSFEGAGHETDTQNRYAPADSAVDSHHDDRFRALRA
jgi:hypothetical protein